MRRCYGVCWGMGPLLVLEQAGVLLAGLVQQATTTTRRDYKKAEEGGVVRATLGCVP